MYRKSTRITLVLIASIHCCSFGNAQSFESLAKSSLDSFSNRFPQEKVYVHTDRAMYLPEETIWFKLYCMTDGLPSYLSKVAYVDIVNAKGLVIDKKMLSLKDGAVYNNIDLPKEILPGKYLLRGYTLWMLNFPDFLFTKEIHVYGKETQDSKTTINADDISVRFFPEGGDLIAGVATIIAFKATAPDESPVDIKGKIIDEDGKELASIKTFHDGMGSFTLAAKAGTKYYANLTINTIQKKILLPTAKAEGVCLQIDNAQTSKIFLKVERSETNKNLYNRFYLVGQQLGKVVYFANVNFDEEQTAALINKKNLLPGILQLTLFDKDHNPVAERLLFINRPLTEEALVFKTDTINLKARKKNVYTFQNNSASPPSLSVSITDAGITKDNDADNILSAMLLTADLHGKIYNPAYYLKYTDSATVAALDLLMRVHGWRRFKWEAVLKQLPITLSYIAQPGNTLSGKVVKAGNKNTAISDGRLDVITRAEDSTVLLNTIQLSNNGEFFIPDLSFRKKAKLYFQGTNAKKEKAFVHTEIYPDYIDTIKKVNVSRYPNLSFSEALKFSEAQINGGNISFKKDFDNNGRLLKEVTVKTKKISKEDSVARIYSTALFSNSDNTIVVDDNTKYFNIWQLIRSSIAGIEISGDLNSPTVYFKRYGNLGNVFGSQSTEEESPNTSTTNGIAYYLNEINVAKDVIDNLSINDVALVQVFKGTSAFILGSGEGAIAVYTKNGSGPNDPRDKSFEMMMKTGFSVEREFYSPDYSNEALNIESDNRTTVYWNPNVKFNKSGKASISFYCADNSKKLYINIQGFNNEGRLFCIQRIIE